MPRSATAMGLASAVLFGAAAPLCKWLLPLDSVFGVAGLLYLGAGLALLGVIALRPSLPSGPREAPVRRRDFPFLAGMAIAGGVLGPLLLMKGLSSTSALSTSLLLNLELPLTLLLAVTLGAEHLIAREWLGAGAVLAAAVLLSASGAMGGAGAQLTGALCVAGACLAWAVDNNLASRVSLKDPLTVVVAKTLPAGAFNLVLAWRMGEHLPSGRSMLVALGIGALSYGLSLVLNLRAVRGLGAGRQAALFGTAPFVGAALSVPLLHERLPALGLAAAAAMAGGVFLLVTARHEHLHSHDVSEHEHLHTHDEHHQHPHAPGVDSSKPHSHAHHHGALEHSHPHVSDAHHHHHHRH